MLRYSKVLLFSLLALVVFAPALHSQEPGSHARIVRISYLEGTVTVNGEQATTNTPIREGVVLLTATDGLAEVQFEDGSTIRMASETQITFAQLARLTTGEALTRTDLDEGEAEFLIPASSAGQFAVNARGKNVMFKDPGRYRILSTNSSPLEIAVWKGEAIVRDRESGKEVTVKKNETFTLNPNDPGQYDLENGLVADDLDQWSKMRDQELSAVSSTYSSTYTSPNAYSSSSSPFSYGYSPFYLYPSAYNCSPWAFGWWDWQPFGFFPGNCFNGGGFAPFFFFPPTNVFVVPGPLAIPRRPPHIRPPTVPPVAASTVTAGNTPTQGPLAIPHRPPHFLRPPGEAPVATAESGSVSVRPGVRSFRFDQGLQRSFNEDNFQPSAPRAATPVAGKDQQPAAGTVSEVPSATVHPPEPLVVPGRHSPPGSATPITPTVAPRPSTPSSHASPPHSSAPSAPSAPSRTYSPPPSSSGPHGGFSGGSMSHTSSSPSHSSGGGGRH
jgi:hypothetical protein